MKNNIRIFLSSTFKDLQKERDYLVKQVFPALRDIAEKKGCPFSWCDLRFGVTSFEEENIIRTCLKNIENCSPCFVGLLGGNYGSIPQNLSKEQINRLSVFHGVPTMIKRKYGYTEIEMRYFISQKGKSDNFDFYFFIGKFNHKFGDWKYILTHPISIINSLLRNTEEDKLSSWKRFVLTKSRQKEPVYPCFDKNASVAENLIYQSIRDVIESKFPFSNSPKEELIWNEQQTYLHSLLSEAFSSGETEMEIKWGYDTSKDILNLYSPIATGKTIYVANLLKESSENGAVCFYYFIGASRDLNTPLNIWKCILYQACKYRNIDYSLYNHINDRDELRKVITQLIHQISKDVLVAIDGFNDDVSCSLEHKNTFISDFPDPQCNIKYLLTSSHKLLETSRVLRVEHKLSNNAFKEFIKKYLMYYYGYSINDQLIPLLFQPKDLREARYCIDETLTSRLHNSLLDNKEVYSHNNNIYKCLKSRIISSINRLNNFYEDDRKIFFDTINKAIQVLSLTKYGILESDICDILNINAEQWTIIYSYLSPFFKSKGCIKLHESVAEQFSPADCYEDIRIQFIENLQKYNRYSQYTTEILYQASQLKSKSLLCEILSNIKTLNNLYETDTHLLAEYLLVIDKACLIKDFEHLLETSLNKEPKTELISLLRRIIGIFHKVLPRYAIGLHFIDFTNKLIKENPIPIEHQLEYNAQIIDIYIEIGKFDDALELLQLSDRIINNHSTDLRQLEQYVVKNLLLKAKLYDNDLQESNEKIKALEIYRDLIDKHQNNLETDIILYVLDHYIMLKKSGENVEKYISIFSSILSNNRIVKENSHLFNKYAVKQIAHAIFNRNLNIESKENDDLFTALFCRLDESLRLYPYSHDNCYNIFFVVELLFIRVYKLFEKNMYDKYKKNVIILKTWLTTFVTLSDLIYSKESIGYANAMFNSSRGYGELADIHPLHRSEYLDKSIRDSIEAENLYQRFYMGDNIITAKLYHNRADIYRKLGDFKKAILYINKAIDIKNKLMQPNEDSLFKSKQRRISLLIDQIIYTEDINCIEGEIELCKLYLKELEKETINNTVLIEQKRINRRSRIQKSEKKFNIYINDSNARYIEVAKSKFEECKRIIYDIKATTTSGVDDYLIVFCNKVNELELYLENHKLHQIFYEKCNDYIDFMVLFRKINALANNPLYQFFKDQY